jgi:hypothetical protein
LTDTNPQIKLVANTAKWIAAIPTTAWVTVIPVELLIMLYRDRYIQKDWLIHLREGVL